MPFFITEPQRIEGTKLGYAIFPYEFDFDDHITAKDGNRKLYVYLLKDSPFVEVERPLAVNVFHYEEVPRDYVSKKLQSFVTKHPEYVTDEKGFCDFFGKKTQSEKSQSKFSELEKRLEKKIK